MILLNDLFMVVDSSTNNKSFIAVIELRPGHIIYSGHFPGYPVTPAVIQLQIVQELLEFHFCRKLKLITIPLSKFLKIIDPNVTPRLVIHIEYNSINELLYSKTRGENDTGIFFKLDAVYQFI